MKSIASVISLPVFDGIDWDKRDQEIANMRQSDAEGEAARNAAARRRVLEDSGFPRRALDAAAKPGDTVALGRIRRWAAGNRTVLVLSGRPGCGKTVAAASWALGEQRSPGFLRAATFAASSRYDADKREAWMKAPGLVLDDLGAEYSDAKGSFAVDLDELVDTFYGDMRRLVITTNCGPDEFKRRYGERVTDRIREAGEFVVCGGESLRRAQ